MEAQAEAAANRAGVDFGMSGWAMSRLKLMTHQTTILLGRNRPQPTILESAFVALMCDVSMYMQRGFPVPLRSRSSAHLSLQNLTALAAADLQTDEDGAHAKNGKSRKRIKKVLSNGKNSGCRCQQQQLGKQLFAFRSEETWHTFVLDLPVGKVLAKISKSLLQQVCVLFWSLCKVAQDALLWSLQASNAADGEDGNEEDASSSQSNEQKWSHRVRWLLSGATCSVLLASMP